MIRNILEACNTASQFQPTDIEPNMTAIRDINSRFYASSHGLRLYSFFENGRKPVVPKKSAVLGIIVIKQAKPILYTR